MKFGDKLRIRGTDIVVTVIDPVQVNGAVLVHSPGGRLLRWPSDELTSAPLTRDRAEENRILQLGIDVGIEAGREFAKKDIAALEAEVLELHEEAYKLEEKIDLLKSQLETLLLHMKNKSELRGKE